MSLQLMQLAKMTDAVLAEMMKRIEDDIFRAVAMPMSRFDQAGVSAERLQVVYDVRELPPHRPQVPAAAPADRGVRRIRLED